MASKIFDFTLLCFTFGSAILGLYFSIKLRITSRKMTMKMQESAGQDMPTKEILNVLATEDQDILRIFEEMERKASEDNPDFVTKVAAYNENQVLMNDFQEYVINVNYVSVSNSDHVII